MVRRVDQQAAAAYRDARRRVLRDIATTERAGDPLWEAFAARVRTRFGGTRWTDAELRRFLLRGIGATNNRIQVQLEADMLSASQEGSAAVQATVRRVFGAQVGAAMATLTAPEQGALVRDRVAGDFTPDRLNLSSRFQEHTTADSAALATELRASLRASETVTTTAERFLEQGSPLVELPEHIVRLRDIARRSPTVQNRIEMRDAITSYRGRIQRLGQGPGRTHGAFTIQSATNEFVERIKNARPEDVQRITDRWVLDRAQHQARVIARHETVEAYRRAYIAETNSQPWTKGYRWTLSPRHPRADICDLYANQDLHGLGPGGYPPDAVPITPHPGCLCSQTAIIDAQHFDRVAAREDGTREPPRSWESNTRQTGSQWLAEQPRSVQRELLGPRREQIFQRQPGRVITPDGRPIPVHRVLGRRPVSRRRGPVVRVAPLVEADRATLREAS